MRPTTVTANRTLRLFFPQGDGDPSLDLAEVRAFQAFAFLLNVWPVLIVACLVAIALDLIKHKTGLLRYFGIGINLATSVTVARRTKIRIFLHR